MDIGICPSCGDDIKLRTPRVGLQLRCPYCDAWIEVIELDPIELDWVYDDDWDDEDWEEEDWEEEEEQDY
ncbi:MAG: lysine biosynthesis protein LysW [Anaerolineae bacterium]|nr:lysine biosynthesis protein LysW [Anaerolineae bacterium]